jgi:hypothetical protein
MSHRNLASRNPPLKTDHQQNVYFSLPDVVTIGLNRSLESLHPLRKNLRQDRLFEGPQNALDRRSQSLPSLKRLSPEQSFHMTEQLEVRRSQIR